MTGKLIASLNAMLHTALKEYPRSRRRDRIEKALDYLRSRTR